MVGGEPENRSGRPRKGLGAAQGEHATAAGWRRLLTVSSKFRYGAFVILIRIVMVTCPENRRIHDGLNAKATAPSDYGDAWRFETHWNYMKNRVRPRRLASRPETTTGFGRSVWHRGHRRTCGRARVIMGISTGFLTSSRLLEAYLALADRRISNGASIAYLIGSFVDRIIIRPITLYAIVCGWGADGPQPIVSARKPKQDREQ